MGNESSTQYSLNGIGWSDFAKNRHAPGTGYSWFEGTDLELFELIINNWDKRVVGYGTTDINAVCMVPVPQERFHSSTILIENATDLETIITKRREGEAPFLKTVANGPTIKPRFVRIVLYSANELKKERFGDTIHQSPYAWEIVCIIASDVAEEPMHPLAMARNQLKEVGGNYREYTSEEYAKAIWYWSKRVSKKPSTSS